MVESGIEAIIVKVASIGLTPRKHLGKTIAALQPEFLVLASSKAIYAVDTAMMRALTIAVVPAVTAVQQKKYQLNVCGEGGEYESLTLDCPLFKKRIVMYVLLLW